MALATFPVYADLQQETIPVTFNGSRFLTEVHKILKENPVFQSDSKEVTHAIDAITLAYHSWNPQISQQAIRDSLISDIKAHGIEYALFNSGFVFIDMTIFHGQKPFAYPVSAALGVLNPIIGMKLNRELGLPSDMRNFRDWKQGREAFAAASNSQIQKVQMMLNKGMLKESSIERLNQLRTNQHGGANLNPTLLPKMNGIGAFENKNSFISISMSQVFFGPASYDQIEGPSRARPLLDGTSVTPIMGRSEGTEIDSSRGGFRGQGNDSDNGPGRPGREIYASANQENQREKQVGCYKRCVEDFAVAVAVGVVGGIASRSPVSAGIALAGAAITAKNCVGRCKEDLPNEPKPIEPKPIEPKPIEPKPIEPKPNEPKPPRCDTSSDCQNEQSLQKSIDGLSERDPEMSNLNVLPHSKGFGIMLRKEKLEPVIKYSPHSQRVLLKRSNLNALKLNSKEGSL